MGVKRSKKVSCVAKGIHMCYTWYIRLERGGKMMRHIPDWNIVKEKDILTQQNQIKT